ncbi:hypothetical protein V6N12_051104 [Hibiscus sabdariffa]|uniref:Uncharacterized protein n=1 Tax=Hibiscus sabdariffa TaxID=183260 RepID=A0ABR2GEU5_9ROSI
MEALRGWQHSQHNPIGSVKRVRVTNTFHFIDLLPTCLAFQLDFYFIDLLPTCLAFQLDLGPPPPPPPFPDGFVPPTTEAEKEPENQQAAEPQPPAIDPIID